MSPSAIGPVATVVSARRADAIRGRLLTWYDDARRDLPWRASRDPYLVLVSEVMLQQTQASRVAERFPQFLDRFPSAQALAAAPETEALRAWSGLGYNRRALALRRTCEEVSRNGWPRDVAGLERLPGVGPYTARAVASLAFDLPVGVVDTNVRRWLLRRLGAADRPRDLQDLADHLARAGRGGRVDAWTHASMEFGATVCRARAPRCEACPIRIGCPSRGRAATVPVARQPPLRGTDRAYRGAVVRRLAAAGGHRLPAEVLRAAIGADRSLGAGLTDSGWARIVAGLVRDGLVHQLEADLGLGGATIEP
jgi:A/G-specific adenine glycosylase